MLEHIPLFEFFQTVSQVLNPGGLALVTNMHSEMGGRSQAGFVDPKTGEKVRPQSYAHTLEDVIGEAREQGFEVVGEVLERAVDEKTSEVLGVRARKWIGVKVWFGVCFQKRS
jgi:cyclopropane fatty-acyl-phospholipid synthase-like methyltransferase